MNHDQQCDCFDCDVKHDRSLTERKAARYLGLSEYTLQKWRVQGRPPSFEKTGRAVRYRARHLRDFRDGLRKRSTSDVGIDTRVLPSVTAAEPQLTQPGVAYLMADQAALSDQRDDMLAASSSDRGLARSNRGNR